MFKMIAFRRNLNKFVFLALVVFLASCSSTQRISKPRKTTTRYATKVSPRAQIVQTAETYIGAPYVYGGKKPNGFDCSGFTSYVFKLNQVSLQGSSRDQSTLGKSKDMRNASKGDLVFFLTKGEVRHVGIVAANKSDGLWVIHSTSSRGVIKENVSKSVYWSKKKFFIKDILS